MAIGLLSNVPVKVVYKWGEVIEYIVVDVLATQGN